MKLLTSIQIEGFRSIRKAEIKLGADLIAFAGLNNSGKSNVLRALNAFFNDETDIGQPLNVDSDYYRPDLLKKKRKRIRISVKFELPINFKFRKGLDATQALLSGNIFTVTKEWVRGKPVPDFFLNDSALGLDDRQKLASFLQLIKYRYVPNRVLPTELIRNEHQSLRSVLIRRLGKKSKGDIEAFQEIENTSARMISSLSDRFKEACPGQGDVSLATPNSWHDLAFTFGYRLSRNGTEIEDVAQGSGIQSLLMFETLYLIDRDYFQQFGWRQAAIWAVEEPESSMHSSLEARVASYLKTIANDPSSRLQIFCTTHSDLILQFSDKSIFTSTKDEETIFKISDKSSALQEAAKLGISRWSHPILHAPLNPIVLVEGKYDYAFLEQAFRLLAPQITICVSYLERLTDEASGGVDNLKKYIKANASAIKTRDVCAPVIVLLDWDASTKTDEFKKIFTGTDPFRVEVWPDSAFNPKLGKSFHGIEIHMPDRIIEEADKSIKIISVKNDGTKAIPKDGDYNRFKAEVCRIVENGITEQDLIHVKDFLKKLIDTLIKK